METWEKILLGVLALIIILWFFPGVKTMMRESQEAPKDWPAVIVPLIAVVAFVIFLISQPLGILCDFASSIVLQMF